MKRLVIVADHSLVVQAIRLALRQTAGFQRRRAASTAARSVRGALAELRPDVVAHRRHAGRVEDALARLREVAGARSEGQARCC